MYPDTKPNGLKLANWVSVKINPSTSPSANQDKLKMYRGRDRGENQRRELPRA